MKIKNYEFKAQVKELNEYENLIKSLGAEYRGLDKQVDTYFNVPYGRLKLREGNIENSLIQYHRHNIAGSKESDVLLYKHEPDSALKEILIKQLGVKVIVAKERKIYYIDNVKFHFDTLAQLGKFVEVEAMDTGGLYSIDQLKEQCDKYFNLYALSSGDLIDKSYSDMILELNKQSLQDKKEN